MAHKTYRLNNLVKNSIHRPYIEGDGKPLVLYTKVPEYKGEEENISKSYAEDSKYSKYVSLSEKNYNSPRNIRRLFITCTKIYIQYYHAPYVGGRADGSNWVESKYFGMSINEVNREFDMQRMNRNDNSGNKSDIIEVTGNPFKVLIDPLVCSNIEEIYISGYVAYAMGISDSIMEDIYRVSKISKDGIRNIMRAVAEPESRKSRMCVTGPDSALPFDMVKAAVESKVSQLKQLAAVGIISRLESVLESSRMNKAGEFLKNITAERNLWWKNNIDLIKEEGGAVVISDMSKVKWERTILTCSPNIYMYDREILKKVFDKFIQTFKDTAAEQYKQEMEIKNGSAYNVYELLGELEEKYGRHKMKLMLALGAGDLNRRDIENVLKTFPIGDRREMFKEEFNIKE